MSVDPITALPSRPSPGAAGAQLGQLYIEHSRLVYSICRMLLRDPDEAEDATQQVFLSAYRNLLTGTEVREPAAWLGTIARNACRRRAVARMREPLAVDDELTLVSPGAEETALNREEAAELYAELAVLPEKQREAVVLRDLYGLRYDEVATALGTSRPAVEALLFRGRRRLQRRLRPGLAAGVLVVPLAVQESIAYAVPGFASSAAPTGAAAAAAAGIPLLAKLAATGAAIGLAGSAGYVAENSLHDPPARPAASASAKLSAQAAAPQQARVEPMLAAAQVPAPPARSPRAAASDRASGREEDQQREREQSQAGDAGDAGERQVEPAEAKDVQNVHVADRSEHDQAEQDHAERESSQSDSSQSDSTPSDDGERDD